MKEYLQIFRKIYLHFHCFGLFYKKATKRICSIKSSVKRVGTGVRPTGILITVTPLSYDLNLEEDLSEFSVIGIGFD